MILEVAERLGYNLIKVGNVYRDKEHDSLIVFPHTDTYYRYSKEQGGNAFNLIMNTLDCNFNEALKFVRNNNIENSFEIKKLDEEIIEENKHLIFPKRSENSNKIIDYLSNERKISKNIIFDLIKRKIIFEDDKHNLCFLGKNIEGEIKNILRRSIENKEFMTVKGSQKKYPFAIENNNNNSNIVVTEGELDCISMYQVYGKKYTYIALSSIADLGLVNFIKERDLNSITINLCLDRDSAGDLGTERVIKDLKNLEKNLVIKDIRDIVYGNLDVKDPNELLIKNSLNGKNRDVSL